MINAYLNTHKEFVYPWLTGVKLIGIKFIIIEIGISVSQKAYETLIYLLMKILHFYIL